MALMVEHGDARPVDGKSAVCTPFSTLWWEVSRPHRKNVLYNETQNSSSLILCAYLVDTEHHFKNFNSKDCKQLGHFTQ